MKLLDSRTGKVIKPIINNSLWKQTTCDVCGASGECTVCSSIFGAFSFSYCQDCFDLSREPYASVVNMVACAGPWPDGISASYQTEVRRQLRLHNKTEEEFIADVMEADRQMQLFFSSVPEGAISDDQF